MSASLIAIIIQLSVGFAPINTGQPFVLYYEARFPGEIIRHIKSTHKVPS